MKLILMWPYYAAMLWLAKRRWAKKKPCIYCGKTDECDCYGYLV